MSDTRRRVKRKELYPEGVERAAVNEVIDKLSSKDARILVTSREAGDSEDLAAGEDFVEFTHEALLENWQHLVTLLDSERASIRKHRALTTMAQEWEAKPQDERHKFLLRAGQLVIAEQWASDEGGYEQLNQLERHFLNDSIQQRNAEEAQQAKVARRLKMLSIGATAAALVAFAVSLYAFDQQGKAEAARTLAETNRGWSRELMSDFVPEITRTTDLNKTKLADSAIKYFESFSAKHLGDDPPSPLYADAKYAIGRVHNDTKNFPGAVEALKKAGAWQYHLARYPDQKLSLPPKFPSPDDIGSLSIMSSNEGLAQDLGYTLNALGHSFRLQGHKLEDDPEAAKESWRTAEEFYSQAMTIRQRLADESPRDIEYRLLQASSEMNLGLAVLNASGPESAKPHLEAADELRRDLLKEASETDKPMIERHIALGCHNLALMWQTKDRKKAICYETQAINKYKGLSSKKLSVESDPADVLVQADLADGYQLRGRLELERVSNAVFHPNNRTLTPIDSDDRTSATKLSELTADEASKATGYFEQAAEIFEVLCQLYPVNQSYRNQLTDVSRVLADLYEAILKEEDRDKATVEKLCRRWRSIHTKNRLNLESDPNSDASLYNFGQSAINCAALSMELQDYDAALQQLDQDKKSVDEYVRPDTAKFLLAKLAQCRLKVCSNLKDPAVTAKAQEHADQLWGELIETNPGYQAKREEVDKEFAGLVVEYSELR